MKKYRFLWSNAHQLFYMLGNIDSYRTYSYIPFNRADVFQVSEGNLMSCYLTEQDLERHVEEGGLLLNPTQVKKYINEALEQCKNHRAFFEKLRSADLPTLSDAELLQYWKDIIDNYAHSVAYFRSTQEEPSRKIVATVTDVVSQDEASDLLMSPELDEINKEEIAWEALIANRFTKEKALIHLAAFPWLFQNSLTYDDTIKELEQRLEGHISRDIQTEKEELYKRQVALLAKYPLLKNYVEILQDLALLRPEVKACWASTGYFAAPFLLEIAQRKNIDVQQLTFLYRSEDINELLTTGHILTTEEITERKLCTAYELIDGTLVSYVGTKALEVKNKALTTGVQENSYEFKGSTARPGRVTGVVSVLKINNPEVTRLFRESFRGGILVTSMTQPNVVDIAKRASAIITDEGGMLCHAAIISREFGIPCIVGTKIATQVLHDGDLVEVDADKGVVRVIGRE
jgi:phosphohistidine swiveling domain-containing protein